MIKFYNLFYLNYFILDLGTIPNVLVFLFFSLILIEGIGRFIFFSGGIKKGLKDVGTAVVLGAAAKLGADLVDAGKERINKIIETKSSNDDAEGKVSSEDKSNTSNDSNNTSNNSNTSNDSNTSSNNNK